MPLHSIANDYKVLFLSEVIDIHLFLDNKGKEILTSLLSEALVHEVTLGKYLRNIQTLARWCLIRLKIINDGISNTLLFNQTRNHPDSYLCHLSIHAGRYLNIA